MHAPQSTLGSNPLLTAVAANTAPPPKEASSTASLPVQPNLAYSPINIDSRLALHHAARKNPGSPYQRHEGTASQVRQSLCACLASISKRMQTAAHPPRSQCICMREHPRTLLIIATSEARLLLFRPLLALCMHRRARVAPTHQRLLRRQRTPVRRHRVRYHCSLASDIRLRH